MRYGVFPLLGRPPYRLVDECCSNLTLYQVVRFDLSGTTRWWNLWDSNPGWKIKSLLP